MEDLIGQPLAENIEGEKKYVDLFNRIEEANILPTEGGEWSPEELKQRLYEVFREYGAKALAENDGKIFTTLSGGLDSTLALALLRKCFPDNEIITFSMGGNMVHPDILFARMAAEIFGSNHKEFIPEMDDNRADIQEALVKYKEKFPEDDLRRATETGDVDVFLLYKYISEFHPNTLLVHDGIDELMGGYWDHRREDLSETERRGAFANFWKALIPNHLKPLIRTSNNFNIDLRFPYLDQRIIEAASRIPLENRTSKKISKMPLREIARELGVPEEILTRSKEGQRGMLTRFKHVIKI